MSQNPMWGQPPNSWPNHQIPVNTQALQNVQQASQQAANFSTMTPAENNYQQLSQLLLLNALANRGQPLCFSAPQQVQTQQSPPAIAVHVANFPQPVMPSHKFFSAPIVQSADSNPPMVSLVHTFPVWQRTQTQQGAVHQPANLSPQTQQQVHQSGMVQPHNGFSFPNEQISFQFSQQPSMQPVQLSSTQAQPTLALVSGLAQSPELTHPLPGAALSTTHSLLNDLPSAPSQPSLTDWSAYRGQEEFSKGASFFKFLEELEQEGVLQRIFRSKDDPAEGEGERHASGVIGWRVYEDRDAIWKDRWKRWYMAGKEGKEFKPNSFHQLLRRLGFFPTKLTSKGSHGYDFENSLVFLWNSKSKYKDRKTRKRNPTSPNGSATGSTGQPPHAPERAGAATRVGSGDAGEESAAGSSSAGECMAGGAGGALDMGRTSSSSSCNMP
mmetsp:Transcript_46597/g.110425  ORF Transcript_46597/g.110425 Transcript_46597/m.110425 type:complete len:440 (-) Transcript_46597:185-1504(-)